MSEEERTANVIAFILEEPELSGRVADLTRPEGWLDPDVQNEDDRDRLYAVLDWDRTYGEFRQLFARGRDRDDDPMAFPGPVPIRRPIIVQEHRPGLLGLVLVALTAAAVGFLFGAVLTAPRSAATAIPAAERTAAMLDHSKPSASGNLSLPSEAPRGVPPALAGSAGASSSPATVRLGSPSPATPDAAPLDRVTQTGLASWMPERFGSRYLALPIGRGHRVEICGAGGCETMVSTDAGPDLAMQRDGRVADIAVVAWERICGLPRKYGLCPVTWTLAGGSTPPPTDVEP